MAGEEADEVKMDAVAAPKVPTFSFLLVDGKVWPHERDQIYEELTAGGLDVVHEFRVSLNHVEARRVLSAAAPAMKAAEERRARDAEAEAERAAAAEAGAAKDQKRKGSRKGSSSSQSSAAAAAAEAAFDDDDPPPPRKPFNPDVREVEVKSLSSDRAYFLHVKGMDAVAVVNEFLGSANPEEWEDYPDGLRPETAEGRDFNTMHSAGCEEHATAVWEIMDDIHTQHQALSEDSGGRMVRKSHWVNVDDLFVFLFPPEMQHPRSTGRLIVFGEYGPFADDGTLRAGWRGRHRITDRELKTMIDEIEREDLIAIFVKDRGLTEEKKQEILQGADESKNKLPNMSRKQIQNIINELPHNSDGRISFHDLQRVVVQARKLRMHEMKRMYPDLTAGGAGGSFIRPPPPAAGRATKLGRKPGAIPRRKGIITRKIDDTEAFKIVTKFLNRESFKICEIDKGNDPALTQNVRLLREQPDPRFDGWDDVCCLRKTQRGSYVKAGKRRR